MNSDSRLPEGLFLCENFITVDEEENITRHLDKGEKWKPVGKPIKSRLVQQYGHNYDYKSKKLSEVSKADPIPSIFDNVLLKIEKIISETPEQLIVNQYHREQGISAHVDSPDFGPVVTTISMGDEAVMIFRNKNNPGESITVPLRPRQAVFITGESRYKWTHEIPATINYTIDGEKKKRSENWRRISLTFRTLTK